MAEGQPVPATAVLVIDRQTNAAHPDGAYASFGAAEHAATQQGRGARRMIRHFGRPGMQGCRLFPHLIVVHPVPGLARRGRPGLADAGLRHLQDWQLGREIVDDLAPQTGLTAAATARTWTSSAWRSRRSSART